MSNHIHPTYRRLDGCWNCDHSFKMLSTEDISYYCARTAVVGSRPLCLSLYTSEHFSEYHHLYNKCLDLWHKWIKDRKVSACGYCRCHRKDKGTWNYDINVKEFLKELEESIETNT